MTELLVPGEQPKGLIEMPESVRAERERAQAEQAAADAALSAVIGARAARVTANINATRPEGVPSTLPTGEVPPSTELTASTVNSYRGARLDAVPYPAPERDK